MQNIIMNYKNTILETIGNTPLVKLHTIVKDIPALILAKVETFNPGHSIKDRMGLKMVEVAEQSGLLKAGGTIIECTSGNTGMGIALAAVVKGYKCIFTTTDKQSKEKLDMMSAMGAEVIVCPSNVEPENPKSYYKVAERLSKEIPNSFWCNQYDNMANTQAHYESTGPEIWEQTDGKITHLVAGVGTGGTISGVAKYLKERNPNIKIWGIETYGSVFKKFKETGILDKNEVYPYYTEGIGKDNIPGNVNMDLIDHFEKVTDKDAAINARRLAREEGLLLGYSAGSAIGGILQMKDQLKKEDVVVVIFHDHGSRYIGKIYNDVWMRERGFLDNELKVKDIILKKNTKDFFFVNVDHSLSDVLKVMKDNDISQLPVYKDEIIVGSIMENKVLEIIFSDPLNHRDKKVGEFLDSPFSMVDIEMPIKELNKFISRSSPAVIAKDNSGELHIVTQYDIIQAL
jgi:cystathionine beta-synthase